MTTNTLVIGSDGYSFYYINSDHIKDGLYVKLYHPVPDTLLYLDRNITIDKLGFEIMEYGYYVNGVRDGRWYHFSPHSYLEAEYEYNRGVLHGVYRIYYDGVHVKREGTYDNDLKTGIWTTYWLDGSIMAQGVYDKNHRIGMWSFYASDGNLFVNIFYDGDGNLLSSHEAAGEYPQQLEDEIHFR